MGSDRSTLVVGGTGEAHAVRRLFLADSSLMPTACGGVNPMITIAALAHHVSECIHACL